MRSFDVLIIGGGAAGLMAAIEAGKRGRRVLVLEGSNKIGKKILMSGGGRCNFTNLYCAPENFLSANPRFCISALSRYTPADFVALVEQHKIPWHEKTAGQLFCDRSSRDILAMLVKECVQANVTIDVDCDISSVVRGEQFIVRSNNREFNSKSLIVATGGLSIPKMGASDFGYRIARQFGLKIRDTSAALVPFTFSGATLEMTGRLSGISLEATLSAGKQSFTEDVLFTHRGLSGPAALQLSSYWTPGSDVEIDLLPERDAAALLHEGKSIHPHARIRTILSDVLPRALVIELQNILWSTVAERPVTEIRDDELRRIGAQLNAWQLRPSGTEGYRTAEVTLGGVDTDELSSQTMECKRHAGLYFVGELVDVTGQLGGFNFQWAWASGHAAGKVA
ncbi:MAG: NAD(P)/FAD-dependent oxidoreductase [Proteobacteria bacterium]|nr:NAD(P)/FAD-dependent oxidoreductase [Pseudomonadota bacterium]MDA0993389.1 NAD(P)/FAD-dependent oxidoreductase [Pseudomonadota bacterium]